MALEGDIKLSYLFCMAKSRLTALSWYHITNGLQQVATSLHWQTRVSVQRSVSGAVGRRACGGWQVPSLPGCWLIQHGLPWGVPMVMAGVRQTKQNTRWPWGLVLEHLSVLCTAPYWPKKDGGKPRPRSGGYSPYVQRNYICSWHCGCREEKNRAFKAESIYCPGSLQFGKSICLHFDMYKPEQWLYFTYFSDY